MAVRETVGRVEIPLEDSLPGPARWRRIGRLIRHNPLGFLGLIIILALVVVGVFAPWIAPYGEGEIVAAPSQDPSLGHLFGTDGSGRDMFSRVVFGARISLIVAFASVVGGTLLATAVGIFSGYVGGWVDGVIQRSVDTVIAFPALLLLLIIVQVLGPSMQNVIFAVGLGIIPGITRVVRGAVLSERNNQYVEAARALGASTPRILFVHIAPNVTALAVVIMTTLLGTAILAEASLSFLGLGIPAPNPSWGTDISEARKHFPIHFWWAFFPGLAISLTVLGFNLLGDTIRDVLDPRLRGRGE